MQRQAEGGRNLGTLVPRWGGDRIPLLTGNLLIGRRDNCDIVLNFANVSSRHCELELIEGYWKIRDLNSSNGIKVNGERCDQKWLLPGDEVAIAKNVYTLEYEPPPDSSPPEDAEEDPFSMSLLEKIGLEKRTSQERQQRRQKLPPPSGPPKSNQRFSPDEDSAMDWLMES